MIFTDFDKITDTIMFLSNDVTLNICMQLNKKNKDTGRIVNFHSEYKYKSDALNKDGYSIKRTIMPYITINDVKDYKNTVILRAQDLIMLKMLIDNNILPWFIGPNRIYFFDKDNKLQMKGKYEFQEINISDYSFLAFAPIVMRFQDRTEKEGVRMLMNSKDKFIDMQIDTFLAFYYFISNVDLYNAGANMANYIKMDPYDIGLYEIGSESGNRYESYGDEWNNAKNNGKSDNNFFNKL